MLESENGLMAGMFCGTTWDSTGKDCATRCVDDDDCEGKDQWCYWVECEDTPENHENGLTWSRNLRRRLPLRFVMRKFHSVRVDSCGTSSEVGL